MPKNPKTGGEPDSNHEQIVGSLREFAEGCMNLAVLPENIRSWRTAKKDVPQVIGTLIGAILAYATVSVTVYSGIGLRLGSIISGLVASALLIVVWAVASAAFAKGSDVASRSEVAAFYANVCAYWIMVSYLLCFLLVIAAIATSTSTSNLPQYIQSVVNTRSLVLVGLLLALKLAAVYRSIRGVLLYLALWLSCALVILLVTKVT